MATQSVDYAAVIRDLEQKRVQMNARLDAAIAAIRQVLALENADEQLNLPGVAVPRANQQGPYRGLSMLDAAIKHIAAIGHGVPNVLLAKALEDGGYRHKSKNFPNTLNSVLWRRAKTVGDIRKSGRGWELAQRGGQPRQSALENQ
jgi:hypothetical protein